jgi:O-antigen ligase
MVDWDVLIDTDVLKSRAENAETGESRLTQFIVGTYMFMDNPIFGTGLESWELNMESYRRKLTDIRTPFGEIEVKWAAEADAHNTFLRLAVELGVIGLFPFLLLHVFVFRKSWRLYRLLPPEGIFGRGLVIAYWQLSIAYLICLNFIDPSFVVFLPGMFMAWSAIIVRRAELAEAQAAGKPIPPGHTLLAPRS